MKKIILAAFLILAPVAAFAQTTAPGAPAASSGVGISPQIGITPTPIVIDQRPPADTSFSVGTGIADLLGALAAIFGSTLATFLTKWVMAVAKKAGVQASQAMSDKLDQIIENGIHNGANKIGADLSGKLNVEVKNQVAAEAVKYAQAHGIETIKGLTGVDPNDPKVVEALQARAAKALNTIGPDAVLSPSADKGGATATAIATASDAPKTEQAAAPAAEKPTIAAVPVAEPAKTG